MELDCSRLMLLQRFWFTNHEINSGKVIRMFLFSFATVGESYFLQKRDRFTSGHGGVNSHSQIRSIVDHGLDHICSVS